MGGKNISAQTDPELRDRFDRFAEEHGLDQSKATRKLVDEGLRANGYGPNGSARPPSLQLGLQGAGSVLVLFALGLFGFSIFAPPTIVAFTAPAAFLMMVAGGGFLFVATVWQAAREDRLPGIKRSRQIGG